MRLSHARRRVRGAAKALRTAQQNTRAVTSNPYATTDELEAAIRDENDCRASLEQAEEDVARILDWMNRRAVIG